MADIENLYNNLVNFYNVNDENFKEFMAKIYKEMLANHRDVKYVKEHLREEIKNQINKYLQDGGFNIDIEQKVNEFLKNNENIKDIKLQLGKKAYKAYVTYEEFGAKLDGTTDDTTSVINCHNYANEHNLPVKQNKGILYMPTANINKCPIINTSTDLSGLTIKFDNKNDGNTVFLIADSNTLDANKEVKHKILSTAEIQTLTTSNSSAIPWLNQYKNHCVVFETDMSLGKRSGVSDDTNTYYHVQPMITNDYGQLSPNNFYCNIADNATNVKMYYLPLTQKNIEIKFGEILLTEKCNSNPRILVNRNNTTVRGGIINKLNGVNESVWSVSLFQFEYCANVNFVDFTGNVPVTNNYGNDITSYVLLARKSYNVKINNNNLLKGHGAIATHFINFLRFENNYINRFDNHYGLFGDVYINNNNIIGIPCCILLGYGSGNVYINNNTFYTFFENGFSSAYHNIKFREDFSLWYSGNIYIDNVYVESNITNTPIFTSTLFRFNPTNKTSGFVTWGVYKVPFVSIKNINFKKNSNESNIRYFYIENSCGKEMKFSGLEIDTPSVIEQTPSYLKSENVTGDIVLSLKNTNLLISNIDSKQGVIRFYGTSQINTENKNCVVTNYGSLTTNGTIGIKTINNYGSLTVNSNITTLNNYGYSKINKGLIDNLYSYNKIEGVVNVKSAFMGGYISLTSLTSTNVVRINGAFIECTTYNMSAGCIVTGSNMYSTTAEAISSVTNYQGFGNIGGTHTNLVNTVTTN